MKNRLLPFIENYAKATLALAITIIMSKCKYIVCTTGNCSIWIMLYRGNVDNIFQFNICENNYNVK